MPCRQAMRALISSYPPRQPKPNRDATHPVRLEAAWESNLRFEGIWESGAPEHTFPPSVGTPMTSSTTRPDYPPDLNTGEPWPDIDLADLKWGFSMARARPRSPISSAAP